MIHAFQLLEPRNGGTLAYCTCAQWLRFSLDSWDGSHRALESAWLEHWNEVLQPGIDTVGGQDANS